MSYISYRTAYLVLENSEWINELDKLLEELAINFTVDYFMHYPYMQYIHHIDDDGYAISFSSGISTTPKFKFEKQIMQKAFEKYKIIREIMEQ